MRMAQQPVTRSFLALATALSLSVPARAQGRAEITINDTGIQAENLTSSQDGTVYFGSMAKGTIYRAGPGSARAEPWIEASTAGLTNVLGVLADDKTNTLWVCQELGIGFVAWSPLGMGFLAGTVSARTRFGDDDFRTNVPRFAPEALRANMPLVRLVQTWARRKDATPAQVALAWLIARKPWIVPIPGTTNVAHLEENVAAAALSFSAEELKELDRDLTAITIQGDRLPPTVLVGTGVEAPPKR